MKVIAKVVFAALYTAIYIILTIDSTGAGHSTFIFFAPLPTWIFVLIALGFTSRVNNPTVRIGIPLLLIVHYAITAATVLSYINEGTELLKHRVQMSPEFVILIIGWYLFGQTVVWSCFFLEMRQINKLR